LKFDKIIILQGWGGKNQSGKNRVVFTGFYHLKNPNKTQLGGKNTNFNSFQ
jgi:hypothetical protein